MTKRPTCSLSQQQITQNSTSTVLHSWTSEPALALNDSCIAHEYRSLSIWTLKSLVKSNLLDVTCLQTPLNFNEIHLKVFGITTGLLYSLITTEVKHS